MSVMRLVIDVTSKAGTNRKISTKSPTFKVTKTLKEPVVTSQRTDSRVEGGRNVGKHKSAALVRVRRYLLLQLRNVSA